MLVASSCCPLSCFRVAPEVILGSSWAILGPFWGKLGAILQLCGGYLCATSSRIRHVRLQRLRDTFKVALMRLFCQGLFLCDVIEDLATRGLSCGHLGLQVGLKIAPKWAHDGPKMPQQGHRRPQDGRKRPQDGFRVAPRCPDRLRDSPKVAPGGPWVAPRGHKMAPTGLKMVPRGPNSNSNSKSIAVALGY